MAAVALVAGCRGCRRQEDDDARRQRAAQAEKERREREKPPLELQRVAILPAAESGAAWWYKPGHWTAVSLAAHANQADLVCDWRLVAGDAAGDPLPLPGQPFAIASWRSFAVGKGQTKSPESAVFFPAGPADGTRLRCAVHLRGGRHGRFDQLQAVQPMPGYQYYLAVLARRPDAYAFLARLRLMQPPLDNPWNTREPYYRLVRFAADRRPPLPAAALSWTSIAAVVWDDVPKDLLEPNQQQALLDWVHWGGQLILSGPDTLDELRDSFLAAYLPARSGGSLALGRETFEELDRTWTPTDGRRRADRLRLVRPWSGVKLEPHPRARVVPGTGRLIVERRVGRGRIVATAFHLSAHEFTRWPGADAVINSCLLGRPARSYTPSPEAADLPPSGRPELDWQMAWLDAHPQALDPRHGTQVRIASRDLGAEFPLPPTAASGAVVSPPTAGPAAWNDFGTVAAAARTALTEAARVEIPHRSFVVWMVAGYVLVLVPVNWLVFRLLGRVEWAWGAAPLIALACSALVVRLAELDVGFVRTQTEIALVETQGDYPRAHVTRYHAVYTSLATTYRIRVEHDPAALAQPFPSAARREAFRLLPGQRLTVLEERRDGDTRVDGLGVSSSTTSLLHSEQMLDLGGGLAYRDGGDRTAVVANHTQLSIEDAAVVRRRAGGGCEVAWVGTLRPGAAEPIRWSDAPDKRPGAAWAGRRDAAPATAADPSPGTLNVRAVIELLEDPSSLEPGEVRLVGRIAEAAGGPIIEPAAAQRSAAAVLLAHLGSASGRDPQPDRFARGLLPSAPLSADPPAAEDDPLPAAASPETRTDD